RAAGPVDDGRGRAVERAVRVADAELVRDAREPGPEHERLDAAMGRDGGMQVLEEYARVRRHRARHVAHQDELPPTLHVCAPAPVERLLGAAAGRAAPRLAL